MLHKRPHDFRITVLKIGVLLKDALSECWEHNPTQLAAALAYYTVFSLTPLLTIAIAIAALVFGQDAAQNQIVGGLAELIGEASAKAIQDTLRAASMNKQTGSLAAMAGTVVLLLGAAGVVGQLQQSLNFIWEVKVRSSTGWRMLLRDRLFSFARLGHRLSFACVSAGHNACVSTNNLLQWIFPRQQHPMAGD